MVKPLLDAEKALIELSGPVRAEAETLARLAKSAAEKAAGKAANAEPEHRDTLTAEAVQLAQDADKMRVPAEPQLVADDVTPENVGTLLDEQGGRISCLSAEGELFDIIAGRYTGKPNMGMFLKGHAGDMLRVNRQGRSAQHVDSRRSPSVWPCSRKSWTHSPASTEPTDAACSPASSTPSPCPWSAPAA